MLTREEMQLNIIRKFGFENCITILFCRLCESENNYWNNLIITENYKMYMAYKGE